MARLHPGFGLQNLPPACSVLNFGCQLRHDFLDSGNFGAQSLLLPGSVQETLGVCNPVLHWTQLSLCPSLRERLLHTATAKSNDCCLQLDNACLRRLQLLVWGWSWAWEPRSVVGPSKSSKPSKTLLLCSLFSPVDLSNLVSCSGKVFLDCLLDNVPSNSALRAWFFYQLLPYHDSQHDLTSVCAKCCRDWSSWPLLPLVPNASARKLLCCYDWSYTQLELTLRGSFRDVAVVFFCVIIISLPVCHPCLILPIFPGLSKRTHSRS